MKVKKRRKLGGFLAALCLGITACGSSNSVDANVADTGAEGDRYLKVWVPAEELDMTRQMCDMFVEKYGYTDLTIECLDMSEANTVESLIMDWSTTADVFKYSTGDGRVLADAGLLLPIALHYEDLKDALVPTAFEAASFDDFLYGVPMEANTWLLYYNKEIFADEEANSIEAMLKKDTGVEYNFSAPISSNWFIEAFYYAKGCTLFGEGGTQAKQCDWNKENGYLVGKYLIDLAKNPSYYEDMSGYAYDYFVEGKLGAFCSSVGAAAGLQATMGEKLGIVSLPGAAKAFVSQLEQCVTVPKLQEMKDYWSVATAFGEGIVQGTITEENLQHYSDVLVENITVAFGDE